MAVEFGDFAVGHFVGLLCFGVLGFDSGDYRSQALGDAVKCKLDKSVLACVVGVNYFLMPEIFTFKPTLGFDLREMLGHLRSPAFHAICTVIAHGASLSQVRFVHYEAHPFLVIFRYIAEDGEPHHIVVRLAAALQIL